MAMVVGGNNVQFDWSADSAVDFEVVNFSVWNGAEISRTIIATNQSVFTAAQQTAYYGFTPSWGSYDVRKINTTTLAVSPWATTTLPLAG